jgi:hypothetical protein
MKKYVKICIVLFLLVLFFNYVPIILGKLLSKGEIDLDDVILIFKKNEKRKIELGDYRGASMHFSKSGQDTVLFNGIINGQKCSYNFKGFGVKKEKTWSIKKVIFYKKL